MGKAREAAYPQQHVTSLLRGQPPLVLVVAAIFFVLGLVFVFIISVYIKEIYKIWVKIIGKSVAKCIVFAKKIVNFFMVQFT